MTQPLVSIITVNYNGVNLTSEMLASLQKIQYTNTEVIVVDNGSSEDPSALLHSYPNIKLIRSGMNLGFAGGNNLGIAEAKGKYLLFLNNDTEVDPAFLSPLVEAFEKDPGLGVASPKILFYQSADKNTIQYAGSNGINPFTNRGTTIGFFEQDCGQFNEVRETSLGHGAAMMIPVKVIRKEGLMPDIYFLYYEEHDWFEMIKRAGYRILYVGTSVVYHKESMTVGPNSPLRTYYMTRGRLLFTRRNTSGIKKVSSLLFFTMLSFPKHVLSHLMRGDFQLLKAFVRGSFWHFHHHQIYQNPRILLRKGEQPQVINCSTHDLKYIN